MDSLSSKGPFPFMIIISCLALLLQSTKITKDNCKNNQTFLSECFFQISFQPPLMEKLECFLTFSTKTNYSVRFSSDSFELQRQVDHMCPQFGVEIWTQDKKPKRLFTTCGGTVNRVSRTFYNFTWGHILYDNKGLIDNLTIIKMQLMSGKPCKEKIVKPLFSKTFDVNIDRSWIIIIILSAVGCLVLIIVFVVIVYLYHFKRKERKTPTIILLKVEKRLSEFVEDGNGKGRDLENDSKDQDSLVNAESLEGNAEKVSSKSTMITRL